MSVQETAPLDGAPDGARPIPNDPDETRRLVRSFVGRTLGGFHVIREIGHGSMGIVFEAVQESLGRKVALKVLPPSLSVTETVIRRFLREAQSVAQLAHDNIVQIHEIGDQDGVFYYAMQFVEGQSLDRVVRERKLTPRECAAITAAAARALFFAHEQGIMHRDIKPANIILTYKDKPVLTDFGLARPEKAATLTESGALVGTPMYMSPEQVRGDRAHIDRRTDIYSLGVTLYEMLASSPPFQAASTQEILRKIEGEEPRPLRRVNPEVPRSIATVCHKAMEKDPERRYQTAIEFALDLERFLKGEPIVARATSLRVRLWRRARQHKVISALALLVAVALGVVIFQYVGTQRAEVEKKDLETRATGIELANTMLLGEELQGLKNWAGAQDVYTKALELRPDYAQAWIERGRCRYFLKKYEDALADFESGLRTDASNVLAKLWSGITKCRMEARAQQEEGFAIVGASIGQALKEDVIDVATGKEAATVCLELVGYASHTQRGAFMDLGLQAMGKVLEKNPRDDEALVIQGRLYEVSGVDNEDPALIDLAFANYAEARKINPQSADAVRHFGRDRNTLIAKRSSPDEASSRQEGGAGDPSLMSLLTALTFNEELALAGVGLDFVTSRMNLDRDLLDKAIQAVRDTGLPFVSSPDPADEALLNEKLSRADELWGDGKTIEAGREYYEVLEIDPNLVEAHQRLAEHYLRSSHLASARSHIEQARAVAPSNPRTLFLAYQVYSAQNDREKMKEVLDAAVSAGHQRFKEVLTRFE